LTRGHVDEVEYCIARHGGLPSGLKDVGAMFLGNMVVALGGAFLADEVVNGSIICADVLHEEEAMADWLERRL
jgi:ferritin-like metal-binding protein YciE